MLLPLCTETGLIGKAGVAYPDKFIFILKKKLPDMHPRGEQGHPIAEHFSRPDHDKDDFRVQVILSVFSSLGFYHTKIMPVLPAASTAITLLVVPGS